MAWSPLPGWLIVRPVEADDRLGSLYVPQQTVAHMTRTQYEVVASGGPSAPDPDDDEVETPGEYAPGDWVIAPQRVAFEVAEESLMLLPERHVWGKILDT